MLEWGSVSAWIGGLHGRFGFGFEGKVMAIDRNSVLDVIAEEALVDRAKLVPEATLESLGIASLDMISIVFALEERCGLVLEQADFEGVQSLGQMVDLILDRASVEQP